MRKPTGSTCHRKQQTLVIRNQGESASRRRLLASQCSPHCHTTIIVAAQWWQNHPLLPPSHGIRRACSRKHSPLEIWANSARERRTGVTTPRVAGCGGLQGAHRTTARVIPTSAANATSGAVPRAHAVGAHPPYRRRRAPSCGGRQCSLQSRERAFFLARKNTAICAQPHTAVAKSHCHGNRGAAGQGRGRADTHHGVRRPPPDRRHRRRD